MAVFGLILALLLPWSVGALWLHVWRPQTLWSIKLGYGFILGLLLTTLLLRLLAAMTMLVFWPVAVVLLVLGLAGIWYARQQPWQAAAIPAGEQSSGERWLALLLLVLILLRLTGLGWELALRPVYPWDAWTTWSVKARVWFELRELVSFVDAQRWLADSTGMLYTIDAWRYPDMMPLIQVWTALAIGEWNEPLQQLFWLACALALALAFYGQARLWQAPPWLALVFTYFLLSLPLLDTHTALAGYADLWLATAFGLAALAFWQWLRTRDSFQGGLVLLMVLASMLLKSEGAVWVLVFLPALLLVWLPVRLLWGLGASVLLVLLVWLGSGGVVFDWPGWGTIRLTPTLLELPYIGRFELGFAGQWWPFVHNFFILDNWHLLWYGLLALWLLSLPRLVCNRRLALYSVPVLTLFILLFVLFFMTDARQWTEQYTTLNRLFLHMMPLLLFHALILVMAWQERVPRTAPVTV